jgi:uncharacterized protein YbjT (DUF2867 family)
MSNKTVIAGASGLIGSKLLNILLHESYYDEVLILVRKELPVSHKKLVQLVIDFDKLKDHAAAVTGHAIFCCLGSTQKKTPDLAVYRKIDHDYPLTLVQLAKQNDVEQYHLVSSIGANSQSSNFYTSMKGETEADIEKAGVKCLHIYRPSFLVGARNESRPRERFFLGLMKLINPLLIGSLRNYRSIPAETVAGAMFNESIKKQEGVFIHSSEKIKLLA